MPYINFGGYIGSMVSENTYFYVLENSLQLISLVYINHNTKYKLEKDYKVEWDIENFINFFSMVSDL